MTWEIFNISEYSDISRLPIQQYSIIQIRQTILANERTITSYQSQLLWIGKVYDRNG